MIKGLFFTAALLVPSLAYAGNPSASLSVQVVPAGLQVPAGAQAAGYTTLAFEADFTQPFYTTLSNWLNCAGASSPKMWLIGLAGRATAPCARVSMVNDGGVQVLDLRMQPGDAPAGLGTAISTLNADNGATQGIDFPNGAYWEATFRVSASGLNNNPNGTEVAAWWSWSDTGQNTSTAFQEYDNPEIYGTGSNQNNVTIHGYYGAGSAYIAGFGPPHLTLDPTVYHTIAVRVTQDGNANTELCEYIDGVLQVCGGSAGDPAATYNQRRYPILDAGIIPGNTPSAPLDTLVKSVRIWTCPGWQGPLNQPGHPCNEPVLTGAP